MVLINDSVCHYEVITMFKRFWSYLNKTCHIAKERHVRCIKVKNCSAKSWSKLCSLDGIYFFNWLFTLFKCISIEQHMQLFRLVKDDMHLLINLIPFLSHYKYGCWKTKTLSVMMVAVIMLIEFSLQVYNQRKKSFTMSLKKQQESDCIKMDFMWILCGFHCCWNRSIIQFILINNWTNDK